MKVFEQIYELNRLLKSPGLKAVLENNQKLDIFFDIRCFEDPKAEDEKDHYIGLDRDALLTSYLDYYQILKSLNSDETLVDLGAGYCRGSLLSQYLSLPRCISLELVKERVDLARRRIKDQTDIIHHDLYYDELPRAEAYYLYFPTGRVFSEVIAGLCRQQKPIKIFICESHGDAIEMFEKLKISQFLYELATSLPRHNEMIKCYEIIPQDLNICFKTHFPLWFILNHKKEIDLYFQGGIVIAIEELELILYQDYLTVQIVKKNRILMIHHDEALEKFELRLEKSTT